MGQPCRRGCAPRACLYCPRLRVIELFPTCEPCCRPLWMMPPAERTFEFGHHVADPPQVARRRVETSRVEPIPSLGMSHGQAILARSAPAHPHGRASRSPSTPRPKFVDGVGRWKANAEHRAHRSARWWRWRSLPARSTKPASRRSAALSAAARRRPRPLGLRVAALGAARELHGSRGLSAADHLNAADAAALGFGVLHLDGRYDTAPAPGSPASAWITTLDDRLERDVER
jgi:hypothetical protein